MLSWLLLLMLVVVLLQLLLLLLVLGLTPPPGRVERRTVGGRVGTIGSGSALGSGRRERGTGRLSASAAPATSTGWSADGHRGHEQVMGRLLLQRPPSLLLLLLLFLFLAEAYNVGVVGAVG